MESFLILVLIAACVHLGFSVKPDQDLKYSGPVVYTNLPPPVLYFPNFPEKPEISRGDEEDKRIEYVPFPYKDLPLLIYQSDSQPPVHVVEKPSSQDEEQKEVSKTSYQTSPAVYQMSDYVQSNQPQQQSAQSQSSEGSREQYVTRNVPDLFPDLQNQQYISIGLSTYQDDAPLNLMYNAPKPPAQPASNPTSQSQPKQNVGQYESPSAMQKSPRQQPMQYYASAVPSQAQQQQQYPASAASGQAQQQQQYPASAASGQAQQQQQYALVQNGGQGYAQAQGMSNAGLQQIQNVMVQGTNGGQQYYQTNQKVVMQYPQGMTNGNRGQQMLAVPQQNGNPQQQYQGQQMMVNMKQQQQSTMPSNNGQQVQTAMPQQLPIYTEQGNYNNQFPRFPQQTVYQQASGNNANSQQYLGVSIQSTNNAQRQMMPKNIPQSMPQQEQMKQQVQSETGIDEAQNEQYVRIGVYPHDGTNGKPQQLYTFVIPQNAQQQVNSEQPKTLYQNQQNSNSMEMKNQQMSQGYYRKGEGNEQNSNQQKNAYMSPNKQTAPTMSKENVDNQMKTQDQNRPPTQNSDPSSEDAPIEYQHILIHIPHNTSPQPQISAQQNTEESSGMRYSGSTRSVGFSDGSNKLQNSAMNNRNIPPNYGPNKPFKGSSSDFSSEYDNLRSPQAMPKFPSEVYSGLESKYAQSLIRNPFENSFGGSKRRPQFRGHPGAYASSNLHYSSVHPFSGNQRFRSNFNRIPHGGFAQASMSRPSFIQSPVRQRFQNSFHPAFPEDFMAEASFHSPSRLTPGMLESSNITDFKFLDDAESEVYYNGPEHIDAQAYRGQNIVEDNAAKLYEKFNHDVFNGDLSGFGKMKTGQTAMELMSFHQPQPMPLPMPPSIRQMPFMPYHYQALQGPRYPPMQPVYNDRQNGKAKYGGFIRKLAALSTSLLTQKLGITNREESKDSEIHPRDGFTVEDIDEPVLMETIQPSSTVIKTDTQGLDGIPIPLNPNRRVSNPTQKSPSPPIIVYKGMEPPMEVYGTKKDIEKMKSEEEDPLEASASETHQKVSNRDSGMDYIDVMYSLLPEFIKHTISNRNDDGASGGWLPVDSVESAALESPPNATVSAGQVQDEPSTSMLASGGALETDTWSAFKEDLKELMRLWPKEEKSDLLTP